MQTHFFFFCKSLIYMKMVCAGISYQGEKPAHQGENRGGDAWNPRYYI
jgi:hypothetical protein